MTKNNHTNNFNYIISLFKKADNNLNNEGWFAKKAWHDLCYAFESYKLNVTDKESLDKMILDNMVVQTISSMYLKVRARKKSAEIADTDDIFYLVAAEKVQMYLHKIEVSSPIIDKIYEDLKNYFSDPVFFAGLGREVLDQETVDTNAVQTPVKAEPKAVEPKKQKKNKNHPLARDTQNPFYIMSRYCMKGMDLTEGGLDHLLGSKSVGYLKSYVSTQFSWTKWNMQRLVLIYLYGGEKITAKAFRESILRLITEEFRKANGVIHVSKRVHVTKVDAINALDALFPIKELRFIIDYGNEVVKNRYEKFLESGVTFTEEQKEFFSKFPSVTAPKPEPVVADTTENRITTTYTSGEGKRVIADSASVNPHRAVSLARAD